MVPIDGGCPFSLADGVPFGSFYFFGFESNSDVSVTEFLIVKYIFVYLVGDFSCIDKV